MPDKPLFELQTLDNDSCFLCGDILTTESRSDEHVFPKWLLHRTELWDKSLVLLNKTEIPYRQLVIPCCTECNNVHLGRLEAEVRQAFEIGIEAVQALPPTKLFQWCGKIYYGLLFKELSLLSDRAKPKLGKILEPAALRSLHTHHIFLQSVRVPHSFIGFQPHSLFIVPTHEYDDRPDNFDYLDTFFINSPFRTVCAPSIALRCFGVGIICAFNDNGMQQECFQADVDKRSLRPLHPIQFIELACTAMYKHSLQRFKCEYETLGSNDGQGQHVTFRKPIDLEELWEEWNTEEYMHLFRQLLHRASFNLPFDLADCPPGTLWTYLKRPDGSPLFMNREGDDVSAQFSS